jgi:ABC-type glycerol-3-phosphate transport system substrate-binding protein
VSRCQMFSRSLKLMLVIALSVSALLPMTTKRTNAQGTIPLIVSVPTLWENTLTPDLLAQFEAQYPGVKVYVNTTETSFFGFGPAPSAIGDQLDSTEKSVTAADVLYVDSSSLTPADTQAGYFLDLAPLVMNDPGIDPADFIPAVWQSYQWDNGFWALPLSTDVILLTYDPAAFDQVGLAYPNERWTIDDFANAAQKLTQYNADGTVATPGFSTVSGGNNQSIFLRALAGASFYDSSTMPNAPTFSNPALEHILQVWYEMVQDGVVLAQGGGRDENTPLRVEGVNGYTARGFRPGQQTQETTRYASLLPNGVAGLSVQGFAVSAGTQNPELAYALAKFLTSLPELANNMFSASPARYSLVGSESQNNNNGNSDTGGGAVVISGGSGGPSGGFAGGPGGFNRTVPAEIQPVVDQGLTVGLPISELRYASYLSSVLNEMSSNGGDALSALQVAEAQAISDMQTAQARNGTVSLYVTPPQPEPTLAPGEIALNCAVNLGFTFRGPNNSQFPNQDQWDQVIADFVAADPQVGAVNLTPVDTTDLSTLATDYDCIILSSNVVQESDLSVVLNLDPLIDNDPTFDRNDVIGNTLAQLQQDNKTWALPLAIEPQMLQYDSEKFAQAGVPAPANGWTTDAFVDALHMLKPYDTDPAPFVPEDPGGSYLMMLIGAFGGLPFDYRTDPPTVNFTDPTTVDAIRQVLDLAAQGYISYNANTSDQAVTINAADTNTPAITANSFNQFRRLFRPPSDQASSSADTMVMTTYPQGSQFNVIAYNITTGYISATAQNPDATYNFLSAVARNPQLFSGMPVRQSLLNDPAVIASQGQDIVAIYQQIDTLLRSPNTIVFPTLAGGGGVNATNFTQEYWLRRAFDNYVLNGADLETELSEAQTYTQAYMECAQSIVVDTTNSDVGEQQRQRFDQIRTCATGVDPTFGQGN